MFRSLRPISYNPNIGYTVLSTEEVGLMSVPEDYMKQLDSGQTEETTSEYGF